MRSPSLLRLLRRLAWCVVVFGLGLHLSVRDTSDSIAVFFYGLPLPILLAITVGLVLAPGASQRSRRIAGVLAGLCAAGWSAHSWCWNSAPEAKARQPGELRVMFWNLSRPPGPLPKLAQLVHDFDPDVICCAEPADNGKHIDQSDWQAMLPNYLLHPQVDEMVWYTRSPILSETTGKLNFLGSFADFHTAINGTPTHFLLVDIFADPRRPRTEQLAEALAKVQNDPRAVVLGDFNTPAESIHFQPWTALFTDAFPAAGRGWRETWPYGLPLLSLDHIWAGKEWRVLDCKKAWSTASDHAALMVRLVPP